MPLSRNSAGHEMQLATNYLGAFALTGLLLPYFSAESQCRIVNVGSLAHRFGKLAFDDFNWEATPYNEMQGYARSKVALLTFTLELGRRLAGHGKTILAVAAHPGFAATEILKNSNSSIAPRGPLGKWFNDRLEIYIPRPADAARSSVLAASSNDVRVRVLGSTNRFTIVLPRSAGTFLMSREAISFIEAAVSRMRRISSTESA